MPSVPPGGGAGGGEGGAAGLVLMGPEGPLSEHAAPAAASATIKAAPVILLMLGLDVICRDTMATPPHHELKVTSFFGFERKKARQYSALRGSPWRMLPSVSRLSLANGGWIRSHGSFARQADLSAAVAHGGTIDVRSMPADRVTASVEQGGRILTVPRGSLFARVTQGGVITYWGNAQVKSSVQHGGVVNEGSAKEINVPLAELGLPLVSPLHPPCQPQRKH